MSKFKERLKHFWWVFLLLLVIGVFMFDRVHKSMNEYNHRQYMVEQERKLTMVDSTIESVDEVKDLIKEAYTKHQDSLKHQMEINKHDKEKMSQLVYEMKMLDKANDLVKIEKVRVKEKYTFLFDSLNDIITQKDGVIVKKDKQIQSLMTRVIELETEVNKIINELHTTDIEVECEEDVSTDTMKHNKKKFKLF